MDRKFHFLLAGNGSYANRGCEAIVRGTTTILRKEFGDCLFSSIYVIESRKNRDAEQEIDRSITHFPLLALSRFNRLWWKRQALRLFSSRADNTVTHQPYLKALEASRECDAVLMLGGDNFTMERTYYPRVPFEHLRLTERLGKPVVLWGATVGPFSADRDFERWAAQRLRRVTLICARETATADYLRSIDVERNVKLVADPAFLLSPSEPRFLSENVKKSLNGSVGLNLSPLIGSFYADSSARVERAAEVIRHLLTRFPEPIWLIPHVTSDTGNISRDDYVFMQRVLVRIGADGKRLRLLKPTFNACQVKWIIGQLRLFVGARLHPVLAAISSGVPTILIGYSNKAKGIAYDVYGHTRWLVDGTLMDPVELCELVSDLDKEEYAIRSELNRIVPQFQLRALEGAKYLRQAIESAPASHSKNSNV